METFATENFVDMCASIFYIRTRGKPGQNCPESFVVRLFSFLIGVSIVECIDKTDP